MQGGTCAGPSAGKSQGHRPADRRAAHSHVQSVGPGANWAIRPSTLRGQTLGWKLAKLSSVNEAEKEELAESLLIVSNTSDRQSGPLMVVAGKP
jgi:hypothetical protein